jgi:hypothetical protein
MNTRRARLDVWLEVPSSGAGKYVSKLKSTSSVKNSVTDSAVINSKKSKELGPKSI